MKKLLFVFAFLALVCGCATDRMPSQPPVVKVFMKADAHLRAGDTNAALAMIEAALDDKKYAESRQWVYGSLLRIMLAAGRQNEAEARYFAVLDKDAELVRGGFVIMHNHAKTTKDSKAMIEWAGKLVAAELPEDLLEAAFALLGEAYNADGQYSELVRLAPECAKRLSGRAFSRIVEGTAKSLMAKDRLDEAQAFIDAASLHSAIPETKKTVAALRLELAAARNDWKLVGTLFNEALAMLDDREVSDCLRSLSHAAIQKQHDAPIRELCMNTLKGGVAKELCRSEAARQILIVEKRLHGASGAVSGLEALVEMSAPPAVLRNLFDSEYYAVIQATNNAMIARMVAVGDKVCASLADEREKAEMRMSLLDGHFLISDYEGAMKMLDAGIPERDQSWIEMAKIKLKAHIALKEGRKQDAVDLFRDFMTRLMQHGMTEADPVSGMVYTREICLGFNARRIGDILSSVKADDEARKSYDEAASYYQKALSGLTAGSKEHKFVTDELALIPKAR